MTDLQKLTIKRLLFLSKEMKEYQSRIYYSAIGNNPNNEDMSSYHSAFDKLYVEFKSLSEALLNEI